MAKKILIGIGTLALAALPFLALAQVPTATMSNCCNVKHDINTTVVNDECVCEPDSAIPANCSNNNQCLSKGVLIAAADCAGSDYLATPDWGGYCTMDTVYTVTDWIFWIFLAFVVIMGVWTGFMFMSAGGDPGKIEKARGMIVYLVIGIIVAVIVKLIPALTRSIIGI